MISTFADTPEVDVIQLPYAGFYFCIRVFCKSRTKEDFITDFSSVYRISIASFFTGLHPGQYHVGTSGKNRHAVFYTALDIMVSDGNDHLSAFVAGIRHKKQAAPGGLSAFIDGAWHSDRL